MFFSGKWHVSVEESPADRGWSELFVSGKKGDHHGATWERYQSLAGQAPADTRGEGEILRPGYGTYHLYGEREPGPQDHDERAVREAVGALSWCGRGPTPVAVHRTSWTDPRAVFAGIKAGRAGENHGHMDAGSFVLDAGGIRWALDLGSQSYHSMGPWSSRTASRRWAARARSVGAWSPAPG